MSTPALIAIARYELTRVARDRQHLFFMLVLPVLVVVIVGSTFGGTVRALPIGVYDETDDHEMRALVERLDESDALTVERYVDLDELERDVRTGRQLAAVVITSGVGGEPEIEFVSDPASNAATSVRRTVTSVVDRHSAELAAATTAHQLGAAADPAQAERLVAAIELEPTAVARTTIGDGREPPDSEFAYTVPSQLVLFMMVSALGAGAALVDLNRLGISRRMLSTPASIGTLIGGLTLSRFVLAVVQAALLIAIGALLFDITWGDPIGVAALVVTYALVAVGAGLLIGSVARTAEQGMAIGVPLAMALGMLGGTMWPLDLVGDTMRTIGHVVPQAWAMDGWVALVFDGANISDLTRELAVLAAFATTLLVLGSRQLTRRLTR